MRKIVAAVISAAFVLAACQTQDPYTGETKTSHATKGAIIGGLLGAGVGALTNTSSGKQAARNALIGAGIGALAGGAIGGYMDQQEAELRQRLRAAGVSVRRQGNNIVLEMASDITFPVDGDQVNPQFYQTLAAVGEVLAESVARGCSASGAMARPVRMTAAMSAPVEIFWSPTRKTPITTTATWANCWAKPEKLTAA